jgi:ATP-dependent DNA helicase PIF1
LGSEKKLITTVKEGDDRDKRTRRLTEGQQLALNDMKDPSLNLFVTGQAGTGKSYIINEYVKWCITQGRNCSITSTTGISACLIGGITLHSWAGVGLGEGTVDKLLNKVKKSKRAKKRWEETDTLIVDEVSLLSPELFEKLEHIGRQMRGSYALFGGIQLILCGDFAQLPPIKTQFLFKTEIWKKCINKIHYLQENVRQLDPKFQLLLSEVRLGKISTESKSILSKRLRVEMEGDIKPTKIYPKRIDVDRINTECLEALKASGAEYKVFLALDSIESMFGTVSMPEKLRQQYLEKADGIFQPRSCLELCVGAQVILLSNIEVETGLCNGSRGVVRDFKDGIPAVYFMNGKTIPILPKKVEYRIDEFTSVVRTQFPLILGFASTVHKSQGSTLDCVCVNLGETIFDSGQAYTALSRVRTLEGLTIESLDFRKIYAHKEVVKFYEVLSPSITK